MNAATLRKNMEINVKKIKAKNMKADFSIQVRIYFSIQPKKMMQYF